MHVAMVKGHRIKCAFRNQMHVGNIMHHSDYINFILCIIPVKKFFTGERHTESFQRSLCGNNLGMAYTALANLSEGLQALATNLWFWGQY